LTIIAMVAVLSSISSQAFAQSDELMQAYNQFRSFEKQGRHAEAAVHARRALELGEAEFGTDHQNVAELLKNLGKLYKIVGRFEEAAVLYQRSLAIEKKEQSPNQIEVARTLNKLAEVYDELGRYVEAEALYLQSLAIFEKVHGLVHREVALVLNNLGVSYLNQRRFDEAESILKRSLVIREKTKSLVIRSKAQGPYLMEVAQSLNNLAGLYRNLGRIADAEPLYKRAISIWENELGPEHSILVTALNNLADAYSIVGRNDEAERLFKRSLSIGEKTVGPAHPSLARPLNNLALLYVKEGRYKDAEPLSQRSLAIWEKTLGPDHPEVARALNNLGLLYEKQGRYEEAKLIYERSLIILEAAYGPANMEVATLLSNLAATYFGQDELQKSLDLIRRASSIFEQRFFSTGKASERDVGEKLLSRHIPITHMEIVAVAADRETLDRPTLVFEAFSVGQLARVSSTGATMSRTAARFAAGNDNLAKSVRDHQDSIDYLKKLEKFLIAALSVPNDERDKDRVEALREEIARTKDKIMTGSQALAENFPEYAELTVAKPTELGDVQKLLGSREALIAYLVAEKKTYVWALQADQAKMVTVEIGREDITKAVQTLRSALNPVSGRGFTAKGSESKVGGFDLETALNLYRKIFAPIEQTLAGANHVFVVADGPLQSLPLGVLTTDKPKEAFTDFSGFRHVPWLAKKYAMTTLPSVSSLRALRTFSQRAKASVPFTGFGDPVLGGQPGGERGIKLASLYRGAIADVQAVRDLAPLPDTADELQALSKTVGGSPEQVYLREKATETMVKAADLSDSRIITFATHGLVAGELKNAEPALVLTPPKQGTWEDDGLLTSSEVAQLKLNAEMVILSACNTAAGDDTSGAEGLSGLAKSFFYAGSRSLLVSHWPVDSDATVRLTTKMLDYQTKNPAVGRAEALRQSMLALMNSKDKPHYAHPLYWAPFVVVGEGGEGKR